MGLSFTTLDVFTKTPLEGNPLAVVTIPPPSQASPITQAQKQAIAREFNLSETVFVHDVEDPSTTSERRIDIFTPRTELPFAGHPTIGAASFLQPRGVKTLITKAGPITCEFGQDGSARASIPHNVWLHQKRLSKPEHTPNTDDKLAQVAAAEEGACNFSIVKGMTFALIGLPSLELLSAAKIGAMADIPSDLLDAEWRHDFESRRYYFVLLDSKTSPDGTQLIQKVRTRLVKRAMEDPATGSAACALSCYLALHVLESESIRMEITQGVEMGRESLIVVDVKVEIFSSGERKVKTVHLGGSAVEVMSGVIKAGSLNVQ
jgi:predicted PhzF superfamily epimerase YddE/YHI9